MNNNELKKYLSEILERIKNKKDSTVSGQELYSVLTEEEKEKLDYDTFKECLYELLGENIEYMKEEMLSAKDGIDMDRINECLYRFLYDYASDENYFEMENLILSEKFCDLIIKNYNYKNYYADNNFRKYVSKLNAIKYANEFLRTLNPKYEEKLNQNISDGTTTFTTYEDVGEAFVDVVDDKKVMMIPIENDLIDSFALVHEQIHDTTMEVHEFSDVWDYFCETPSILSEFLMKDYLEKNNFDKKELNRISKSTKTSFAYIALLVKTEIMLLKEVLTTGYINKKSIFDITSEITNICGNEEITYEVFTHAIDELYDYENLFYYYNLRYVIGDVLASYLHDKILKDPKLLKEFASYNEYFKNLDIEEVFMSIGLDMNEETYNDIDGESYKKLEKAYKEESKRVW